MGRQFPKQTIRDIVLDGRTLLVRTDYNVPLTTEGKISDDLRIRASLPTLRYLLERNCKVVIMSHLGRPKGKDVALSLSIVAQRLAKLLDRPVRFIDDCVGDKVRQVVRHTPPGSVVMLENLRFYEEEEADDATFAQAIQKAVRADYLVQDGFGVVHRAHASTHAITLCVPSGAGFLLEKEFVTITQALEKPRRPLVSIIGGAKVSDKIRLIERLVAISDTILIGGAMANTFLQHRGMSMGASVVEPDQQAVLDEIYEAAAQKVGQDRVDDFLVLPVDVAVEKSITGDQPRRELKVENLADDDMALDIGTLSIEKFTEILKTARTVLWNGPLGYSEFEVFAIGSARVALAIAQNPQINSVVGGGDTADFILKWDGHDGKSFTHVSTGGGASMELMAGKTLPGIESLLDAHGVRMLH